MNIGIYIRALLPEHDTVVIPGLGAFVSSYKPAQIDEKSGEMKPPSKAVSFETKIRNNDGLLAGKIAQEEGIALIEAYRKLENEREEILYRLDKGERVTLDDLGELWYDKNNKLRFFSSEKDILLLDAYGLESEPLKTEPEPEPKHQPEKEPENKNKKIVAGKKENPQDPFKEETPIVYEGATLKDAGSPPGKSKKAWWLLLFLIPLFGGAIYIFTRNSGTEKPPVEATFTAPQQEAAIPPADTTDTDTVNADAETAEEEDANLMASEVANDSTSFITPDTSKYYLISGSFEDYDNAQKFIQRLRREGYQPFHLGKHGSFYLVGVDTFDNPIEAYGQQYNYLDKHPESGAWVFAPGKKTNTNQQ